jgi:predicted SAM-dependent methyltransferase
MLSLVQLRNSNGPRNFADDSNMVQPQLDLVRLNLGCGSDVRPGWVNVDKFPATDDVVQAEMPLLPFEANYADEVLLSHVLEHFGFKDGQTLCQEIHRVLRPSGFAVIEVPDIQWCMAQFLGAPEPTDFTDVTNDYNTQHRWGLWAMALWGDQHNDGLYHKWGYTAHRLFHLLRHVGFAGVDVNYGFSHGVQVLIARAQKGN